MAAYQAQNKKVSSCKCGPDYIDPMFHKEVLGVDSKNLDLFFSSEDELRKEYAKHAADAELRQHLVRIVPDRPFLRTGINLNLLIKT